MTTDDRVAESAAPLYELQFELNGSDLFTMSQHHFYQHHLGRQYLAQYRKALRNWTAVATALTLILILYIVRRVRSPVATDWGPWILGAFTLYVWYIVWAYLKAGSKNAIAERLTDYVATAASRYHTGPQHVTISADACTARTPNYDVVQHWRGVERIEATESHAFISRPDDRAFVIPARAFPNQQEFQKFVEVCRGFVTAVAGSDYARVGRFLRDRDFPCPKCGYNLRDCNTARCPECGMRLDCGSLPEAFRTP